MSNIGVVANHNRTLRNRAISILLIAAGTMFYTWVKSIEGAPAPARSPPDLAKDDVEARAAIRMNQIDEEVHDWQDEKGRQAT